MGGAITLPAAAVALLVLGAASRVEAAPAHAAGEPAIRILVARSTGTLRFGAGPAHAPRRIAARGRGLVVEGREVPSPLRLEPPGPHAVAGRRYRGAIEFRSTHEGLEVVNEIPLEAYVAGTLLGEMYGSWDAEVLRTQAVAVRTYALHRRARATGGSYHLEATTAGQVYLGFDSESPAAWAAVDATRGQYLAWEGEPILAAFHSTAGGRTASAAEVWGRPLPYLVSVPVPGEEASPHTYWRAPVSAERLARALADLGQPVGRVRDVRVARRSASGRVLRVAVRGSAGAREIEGRVLRAALGNELLRSTMFEVRAAPGGFLFVGSGHGHGVGMSQWGARAMAQGGADHRAILAHFYPGATLRRLPAGPRRTRGINLAEGAR